MAGLLALVDVGAPIVAGNPPGYAAPHASCFVETLDFSQLLQRIVVAGRSSAP